MTRKDIIKALEICTMPNRKVIKTLEICTMPNRKCEGCPLIRKAWCKQILSEEALSLINDGDMVRVVRCAECVHWEPNNAEEGDYSGRCRYQYGPCQNQETDGMWFCADGVRIGE